MAQVEISINNRVYLIACDDGQEAHLAGLGRQIDEKVAGLTKHVGQVGDARLLLMVSLIIADELADAKMQIKQSRSETPAADQHMPTVSEPVAAALENLAERVEAIAAALSHA